MWEEVRALRKEYVIAVHIEDFPDITIETGTVSVKEGSLKVS